MLLVVFVLESRVCNYSVLVAWEVWNFNFVHRTHYRAEQCTFVLIFNLGHVFDSAFVELTHLFVFYFLGILVVASLFDSLFYLHAFRLKVNHVALVVVEGDVFGASFDFHALYVVGCVGFDGEFTLSFRSHQEFEEVHVARRHDDNVYALVNFRVALHYTMSVCINLHGVYYVLLFAKVVPDIYYGVAHAFDCKLNVVLVVFLCSLALFLGERCETANCHNQDDNA